MNVTNREEVALNQGPSHADDSGSNPDLRAQDRQESLAMLRAYEALKGYRT